MSGFRVTHYIGRANEIPECVVLADIVGSNPSNRPEVAGGKRVGTSPGRCYEGCRLFLSEVQSRLARELVEDPCFVLLYLVSSEFDRKRETWFWGRRLWVFVLFGSASGSGALPPIDSKCTEAEMETTRGCAIVVMTLFYPGSHPSEPVCLFPSEIKSTCEGKRKPLSPSALIPRPIEGAWVIRGRHRPPSGPSRRGKRRLLGNGRILTAT